MNAGQEKEAAPITDAVGDVAPKATSTVDHGNPPPSHADGGAYAEAAAEVAADKAFAASMMNAERIIINEPEVALQAPKPRRRSRLSQTVKVYDSIDVIEVDGIRYSRGFFDMMNARPIGSIFRLTARDAKSKAVTFEELPPSLKR